MLFDNLKDTTIYDCLESPLFDVDVDVVVDYGKHSWIIPAHVEAEIIDDEVIVRSLVHVGHRGKDKTLDLVYDAVEKSCENYINVGFVRVVR